MSLPSSFSFLALTRRRSIFGYPLDEARLQAVVRACALERDLEVLPDGMETFVGERGISLSGASLVSCLFGLEHY